MEFEDPIDRFGRIYKDALAIDRKLCPEPTAMTLATVGPGGQPSARVVLLKSYDGDGFVFYTNYESRKGRDLLENRVAALCFHWPHLEIQVRVEGDVGPVRKGEADEYFASRARESQLGAWASQQSRPVEHDGDLERRLDEYARMYEGRSVPRPPWWSGFRVTPQRIEFWHNRASRLHLRHLYARDGAGWKMDTLYP